MAVEDAAQIPLPDEPDDELEQVEPPEDLIVIPAEGGLVVQPPARRDDTRDSRNTADEAETKVLPPIVTLQMATPPTSEHPTLLGERLARRPLRGRVDESPEFHTPKTSVKAKARNNYDDSDSSPDATPAEPTYKDKRVCRNILTESRVGSTTNVTRSASPGRGFGRGSSGSGGQDQPFRFNFDISPSIVEDGYLTVGGRQTASIPLSASRSRFSPDPDEPSTSDGRRALQTKMRTRDNRPRASSNEEYPSERVNQANTNRESNAAKAQAQSQAQAQDQAQAPSDETSQPQKSARCNPPRAANGRFMKKKS